MFLILLPFAISDPTINPLTRPHADTLYCPISGGCAGGGGGSGKAGDDFYLYNDTDTMYFNESLLNLTIDDRSGGTSTTTDLNESIFYNKTSATYNGSLIYEGFVSYIAGDKICNASFEGTHFCSCDEVVRTRIYRDIDTLETWDKSTSTGYAWCNQNGAKYAPATIPFDDCMGWQDGSNDRGGNFYMFPQNRTAAVTCGSPNERSLACCMQW